VKILLLCHRFPFPPNRGGKTRAFHVLKYLSRDHEITLASLLRRDEQALGTTPLEKFTVRQLLVPVSELSSWGYAVGCALGTTPSSFGYFHSPRLASALQRELAHPYDLVLAMSSSMGPYVAQARAAKVLDFTDLDSQKWFAYAEHRSRAAALAYRWEGRKVERAETELARRFDLCTCTTPAELDTLRHLGTARRAEWFANGVDAEYFRPCAAPYDADAICFLGRMDYYPNADAMIWFCDRVIPALRARRPRLTLSIIGANPSRRIRRLAERPGIQVTGTVDDVRPRATRAALSVAPLRIARGTQNKILESLAMGVPVVASSLAARGTQTVPGEHLLTADGANEFVAAILRLLDDPAERRRLSLAGRARMLTHHDWAVSIRRLDDLLRQCVSAFRPV
jgi:sugar transferase (PEP-CTERM/EpsH1 system associated)